MSSVTKLLSVYEPAKVEGEIYQEWLAARVFAAAPDSGKTPFVIVIPPPNVTGSLHMGHALDNTIQDVLIRFKRMQGFEALWIPGTDHAGIATQAVVEKELLKEGKNRWDLGREAFIKKVWQWKEQYGRTIIEQLKRLGCSCDWERERFTLDQDYSLAVREAFVRLYEEGLIYRGQRMINWCPNCLTALSDLEVEHREVLGQLYYLHYPRSEQKQGIVIATTRPETILADTAVAVNPQDKKYKKLLGKKVLLPLVGRELPVIADALVDPEFGTGALKITPAHDPVDFEIGERHKLQVLVAIDEKGYMNEQAGLYQGLSREDCRKKILEDLKTGGFLVKVEDYTHSVGHCYRCHSAVEPYLSWQWFVKMESLAKPAIEAVNQGEVKFIPERFAKVYLNWMENIKDWCISRQLWWGHRIPVWSCRKCGFSQAFRQEPESCPQCGEKTVWRQEEDVLDTWFSSALWPFATMGWPRETADLNFFYPTSVLVTARDIIFLWVARMIMTGLKFRGKVPFSDVFIHSTILAPTGQRMSKSLGTGVDPLELFEKYGTDATRFGLVIQTEQGQDLKYSEEKIINARNFMNKIWNAFRYSSAFLDKPLPEGINFLSLELNFSDRWILSRVNHLTAQVIQQLEQYEFWQAGRSLYHFFWDDFCDWYLEITKAPLLEGKDEKENEKIKLILQYVFKHFLKLAHPFIPFITEKLWGYLPGEKGCLIASPLPQPEAGLFNQQAEEEMNFIREVVRGMRNLRNEIKLPPGQEIEIVYETALEKEKRRVNSAQALIKKLAKVKELIFLPPEEQKPKFALSAMIAGLRIYLPLKDFPEVNREITRLDSELQKVNQELESLTKKLNNPQFIQKADKTVVERERERHQSLKEKADQLKERLKLLSHSG